jgi:catechol 2,3-dioxygenase-like lactoylglutathione lyase family enzyme
MAIKAIDHIALPIENVNEMLFFYQKLGFEISDRYAPDFYSVNFGDNKINFHAPHIWKQGKVLKALTAIPGCGDFCFVWDGTEDDLTSLLHGVGAEIIDGPVKRAGGRNAGRTVGISRYVRDPDSNLLEFIVYPKENGVKFQEQFWAFNVV